MTINYDGFQEFDWDNFVDGNAIEGIFNERAENMELNFSNVLILKNLKKSSNAGHMK